MPVTIRWSAPRDANWTHSRVYRATSRTGSFSLLVSVAIGTYSYLDSDGNSTFWYRVSFYDGINESSLSEAIQGNTTANYCSLAVFRDITPFGQNEITDVEVMRLMPVVSKIIRNKITSRHILEQDNTGPIDGANKIFYVKNLPIGDKDMDGDVDEGDVDVFYATLDANNVRSYGSAKSVTSLDARGGRITMTTAPTTTTAADGVFITYLSTVEDINYDDVRLAANYMLAHFASFKIKGDTPNYSTIEAPYIRSNVAASIGLPYDVWKYPFLRSSLEFIREILGKTRKGLGFTNVIARRYDE